VGGDPNATRIPEPEIRARLAAARVAIVGCGGLGSNAAAMLVRTGVRTLTLIDFDRVEESNLNRQLFFRDQLGLLKTEALEATLRRIEPDLHLTLVSEAVTAATLVHHVSGASVIIEAVDRADVKAMIDKKDKVIYLDVRDAGEFSAGHLPGAMNISRGTLEFNVFSKIPDQNAKIIVYCKTAGRSTLATKTLNDLGFKNAILMDAQYEDWVKAGYPVER